MLPQLLSNSLHSHSHLEDQKNTSSKKKIKSFLVITMWMRLGPINHSQILGWKV